MRVCIPTLALMAILTGAPVALAQTAAPRPDPVLRDAMAGAWTSITGKLITMAEDFPESKYDFKPVEGVRTFADQLRHVAFWNQYVARTMKGEKVDPAINELSKAEYPTKAAIVAVLKSSAADAAAQMKAQDATPSPKATRLFNTFTEHAGEHYGQLVVYYRLNGIVPPESRPAK
jgi:uncharacterized damage-inducible protein DinB